MKLFRLIILSAFILITISCSMPVGAGDDSLPGGFPYNASDDGNREITVSTVEELMNSAAEAKEGNLTVYIADGIYNLTDRLWISGDNVTYRSLSGNRDSVILKGKGMDGSVGYIFSVAADDFTARDLTLGEVAFHGVQVHGELDADNVNLINLRFYNINEQMIKGSYDKNSRPDDHCDCGLVENCLFEYTAGHSRQYYCGGIDVHHGEHWVVRNNLFRNIISPDSALSEGAVHFWSESKDVVIDSNRIINCDRGIMLGFDTTNQYGGTVINNMIHTVRDTGLYLANCRNVNAFNNTIFIDSNYPNAIEYRFDGCDAVSIGNNLTNRAIVSRDNASAQVENNVTSGAENWFVNASEGDLHLAVFIDCVIGKSVDQYGLDRDFDGDKRPSGHSDIGADQRI